MQCHYHKMECRYQKADSDFRFCNDCECKPKKSYTFVIVVVLWIAFLILALCLR